MSAQQPEGSTCEDAGASPLYVGWLLKRDPKWSLPWYSRKYFVVTADGFLLEFRNDKEKDVRAKVVCRNLQAEGDTGTRTIDDEEYVTFTLWGVPKRRGPERVDLACETDAERAKLIAAVEAGAALPPARGSSTSDSSSGEDESADAAQETEDEDGEDSRGDPGHVHLLVRVWTRGGVRADYVAVQVRADCVDLTALNIVELPAELRRLAAVHTAGAPEEGGVEGKVRGGAKRPRKGRVFDPLPPCPVRELAVASRVLEELPKWVGELEALEVLRVSSSCLTSLPQSLARLRALTTLQLQHCAGLSCLPDLSSLTALETLDLQGCVGLEALPASVCALLHLHTLNVHDCAGLRALPPGMASLQSLLTLDVGACKRLRELPEGVAGLSRLLFLDLSGRWRTEGSGGADGGRQLDGAQSKAELEAQLEQLLLESKAASAAVTSAKSVPLPLLATAGGSQQRFLGDDQSVVLHTRARTPAHQPRSAHGLASPNAARSARVRLLHSIAQVRRKLEVLEGTGLRELPSGLEGLAALQHLSLARNRWLTYLPEALSALTALRVLDLEGCPALTALPDWTGTLQHLQTLNVCQCHALETLPQDLNALPALHSLRVHGCERLEEKTEVQATVAIVEARAALASAAHKLAVVQAEAVQLSSKRLQLAAQAQLDAAMLCEQDARAALQSALSLSQGAATAASCPQPVLRE